jgi:hypothetical protein
VGGCAEASHWFSSAVARLIWSARLMRPFQQNPASADKNDRVGTRWRVISSGPLRQHPPFARSYRNPLHLVEATVFASLRAFAISRNASSTCCRIRRHPRVSRRWSAASWGQIGFELGEGGETVEEHLPHGIGGIINALAEGILWNTKYLEVAYTEPLKGFSGWKSVLADARHTRSARWGWARKS